jgi:hypothetical protein
MADQHYFYNFIADSVKDAKIAEPQFIFGVFRRSPKAELVASLFERVVLHQM